MSHPSELNGTYAPTTDRYNFVPGLSVVVSDRTATFGRRAMNQILQRRRLHKHTGVRTYVLLQRLGVPYEIERTVCSDCGRVLDERSVRRAAA